MNGDHPQAMPAARVIAAAMGWLDTPYRHQAARKGVGCDCLGLLRGVWEDLYGKAAPEPGPYAMDWAEFAARDAFIDAAERLLLPRDDAARPDAGDVMLFRWRPDNAAKHAGIMLEHGRFIHAYQGAAVVTSALVPQWRRRIAAIFRFPLVSRD